MSKPIYQCNTCDKRYSRKSSLEKHTVLCTFLIKTEREKQIQSEEDKDIPSYIQLVGIVQELSLKYSLLEKEMTEMQKWVEKKKKKINVLNWLNTNIEPEIFFEEWVDQLRINEEHLTFLMSNSIVETFQTILEENLTNTNTNTNTNPIKCFSQKNGVFYVYKSIHNKSMNTSINESISISESISINESISERKSKGEWHPMTFEDSILLLKKIQGNLLKEVSIWKTKNKEHIDATDHLSILYNKTIMKLMDISFSKDTIFGKIKANLYTYLKTDLKNLFEYEFEF